jgi:copper chaperone
MHCASCSALIEDSLTEQAGVSRASVDLDSALAVIDFDTAAIGVPELCAVVADAGYGASPIGENGTGP